MSTRYLKKVYGTDNVVEQKEEEIENETSDVNIGRENQKLFNIFDLLNENSENEIEDIANIEIKSEDENFTKVSNVKKKKKKCKKKKKQVKNQEIEETAEQKIEDNENLDEIEIAVQEINKLLGEPTPSTSLSSKNSLELQVGLKSKENILMVENKYLNVSKLKRIFDSTNIEDKHVKSKTRAHTGHLKKTWLVTPNQNMQPSSKSGLSMKIDETISQKQNNIYFVYEHSTSYRQIQQKFINAVESMNPTNIIKIVHAHSYHIDSLLQCAELYKMSEELALSANFIERALFYLECAFHPMFNMTTANCRLDYRKQQNRALFIALFKHLILVEGLACYRTSLELCKLLLSLDPEGDPLAAVLMIDFYAIQSKEYDWFIEFCNLWESSRNLQQLPNIAYSLSLAYLYSGKQEKADEMLQNALIMFPGILMPLLAVCNVHADSKVMSHEYFLYKASSTTLPALEKLQALYIARSYQLWKKAEILPWLEKQVNIVLDRVDAKDSYVKFCEFKRGKRYQGKLPRNILRHLIVSDLKDVTINSHEIENEGPILSHDPLPPTDSINIYTNPRAERNTNQSNSNPLSLFFSSIFNMHDNPAGRNIANQHNENNDDLNEYD